MQVVHEDWLKQAEPYLHPASLFRHKSLHGHLVVLHADGYRKQQHILGLPDFLGWHVEGSHSSHVPDPLTSLERCFVKLAQHAVTTDTQGAGGQGALYVRVTLIRVKAFGAHKPNAQQLGTPAVEEAIVDVYVSLGLPEWLVQDLAAQGAQEGPAPEVGQAPSNLARVRVPSAEGSPVRGRGTPTSDASASTLAKAHGPQRVTRASNNSLEGFAERAGAGVADALPNKYLGVRHIMTEDGTQTYMATIVDGEGGEHPVGLCATPEDAARAHDAAALRLFGLAGQVQMNQPAAAYPDVLAELGLHGRRTNSSEELDTPLSPSDTPHWPTSATSLAAGPDAGDADQAASEARQSGRQPRRAAAKKAALARKALLESDDEEEVWVPAQGKRRSGAKKAGTVHKGAPGKRPAQGGHKGEEKDLGGMLAVAKGRRGNDIGKKASGAKRAVETKKRAGKAAPYKGVTIKNHRLAAMVWNQMTNRPAHLGYWDCSLDAARIADKGQLCLKGRRNVRESDINFPPDSYSAEEIPDSIEELQAYMKKFQDDAKAGQQPQRSSSRNPTQKLASPAAVGEKRWSHYIGVTWDTDSNHWRARFVPEKGPVEELGLFGSQQEAGEAYDRHALQALGPKGVRNHPPSYYTGRKADDAEAHKCLKLYAEEGEAWLLERLPASKGPAPGPSAPAAQASGPVTQPRAPAAQPRAPATQARALPAQPCAPAAQPGAQPGAPAPASTAKNLAPLAGIVPNGPATPEAAALKGKTAKQNIATLDPDQAAELIQAGEEHQGVRWIDKEGKWEAVLVQRARMQKHLYTVGMYKTALEAAFAHDAAILSTGGHARELNFPDQEIRVSARTRRECIDLAMWAGKPSSIPRSLLPFQAKSRKQAGASNKGRVRKREELEEEEQYKAEVQEAREEGQAAPVKIRRRRVSTQEPAPAMHSGQVDATAMEAAGLSDGFDAADHEAVAALETLGSGVPLHALT